MVIYFSELKFAEWILSKTFETSRSLHYYCIIFKGVSLKSLDFITGTKYPDTDI